jgi:hypothetical protein
MQHFLCFLSRDVNFLPGGIPQRFLQLLKDEQKANQAGTFKNRIGMLRWWKYEGPTT